MNAAIVAILALSQGIIGGTVDEGDPAVVAIRGSGLILCTGSLIAPNIVLSAGHCANVLGADIPIEVVFGTDATKPTKHVLVRTQRTHPQYTAEGAPFDFALFELDSAISDVEPLPIRNISIDQADVGMAVRHVGYGVSDEATSGGIGTKRQVTYPISQIDDQLIWSGDAVAQTCSRDSGAPAFVMRNGVEEIAGVVSDGPNCHEPGWDDRTDIVSEWIWQTNAEWNPVVSDLPPQQSGCSAVPVGSVISIAWMLTIAARPRPRSRHRAENRAVGSMSITPLRGATKLIS